MSSSERRCCVERCGLKRGDNAILHLFPNPDKDEERYQAWIEAIGNNLSTLDPQYVYKNRRVCHAHFETKYLTWSKRLCCGAVPTLLLPDLAYTQIKMHSLSDSAKRIVWVDLEMTGLNIDTDHIMEIACLVTDSDLNIVATGPNLIIHQPEEILKQMHPWCLAQHGESGLTKASLNSKISVEEAENQILQFLSLHVPEKRCPLGGNSVYMDRLFLLKYMPKLNSYLHYRIVDVSTIKELARRWYPKDYSNIPQKKFHHRCLNDILESVEEMKYYKDHIFKREDISE